MAEDSASVFPWVLRTHPQRPLKTTSIDAVTLVPPSTSSKLTALLTLVNLVSASDSTLSGGESFIVATARLPFDRTSRWTVSPSLFATVTAFVFFDHLGMASKSA